MKLLTVPEMATALNVSQARGYELVRKGLIPAIRIGRQVRVHPDQLERWMAEGGTNAGSEPTRDR